MAKQQTDHLLQLIKSMSKSEKRNFKLLANRAGNGDSTKFIRLFDILDKQHIYNEEEILAKAQSIKPRQLSNLKAHLYKQLLKSLRQKPMNVDQGIQLREQLDYAKILYNKGLYKQSLKILSKAKQLAKYYEEDMMRLEIVEFEKLIELQYVTYSSTNRAEELTDEATRVTKSISRARVYSNFALQLYDLYLKKGSVKDKHDLYTVNCFFKENFDPPRHPEKNSFYERLYIYQSYVWYYYIIQEYLTCYKYAQKWVDLYNSRPVMISVQPDMYMKGINILLSALYMVGHYNKFTRTLQMLKDLKHDEAIQFTHNNEILYNLFVGTHSINKHFLEGTFTDGLERVKTTDNFITQNYRFLDNNKILILYYKFACMYFGSGDYHATIKYLNKIMNYGDTTIRQDIHTFTRILNLISHYELGNDSLIEYQVRSTYHFLAKLNDTNLVERYVLGFLRRLSDIDDRKDLGKEFDLLRKKLVNLKDNPFAKRAFLYLDIISWLESKMQNRPVQDVIQEKANNRMIKKPL